MESSPSYSPEDRNTNRDRDGKERSYQPSPPPESMFVDPRRQEAPRAPLRTPLEGVINLRPVGEAAQGYMQQQAEQAEAAKDKDKKDEKDSKRDDYAVPTVPAEPTAPTETRPVVEQPAETPVSDQREDVEPLATEQERRAPEQPAPVYAAELNAVAPEQADEDASRPVNDGIQRAWYYTPSQAPAQPSVAEYQYPVPAAYGQEQVVSPSPEASVAAPEDWPPHDAAPVPEYPAEQPASPQPEAEPAVWEAPQDIDPVDQATSSNPLFGVRTLRSQSQHQYATTTALYPFGGPNNPNTPNTPNTPSGPGGPYASSFNGPNYNQQPYATTGSLSSTLERHLPVERHTHRGLVLGIVGGLLLEHHLAKNRDRKLSERIDKLQKENTQVQKQTYWANQELQHTQQALRTEQQRTQEEIAKLRTATPEAPVYAPPTAETRADVSGAPVYAAAGVGTAAANMIPNRQTRPEQRPVAMPQPEQRPDQGPDQQQEYVDNNGKSIRLRPGEHIRRSEWHTYVEKDGHVVDAIDYGRALHEEQQQELGHVPQFDNSQTGAAQGQMFGTNQGMYGAVNPSLPSGMTAPSLPTGQPTHADPQHQLPEHTKSGKQVASNFANPWFWLMLALIFAAFFITITV